MLTAFQNGSVWVWLSAFIWGLGNLIRRQFVKGTLFLAAEAGVVLFTIQSGLYNLDKLTTLGTVAQQKVWNDEKSITSAADLSTVPAELIGCFNIIFYQSAEDAVFKALGVE